MSILQNSLPLSTSDGLERFHHLSTIKIIGVDVYVDDQGRLNLNSLHKAFERKVEQRLDHKAPSQWTRNQPAKDYVHYVSKILTESPSAQTHFGTNSNAYEPISITHGGSRQGVFAHLLIALEYARWLDVEFSVMVNMTYINVKQGFYDQENLSLKDQLYYLDAEKKIYTPTILGAKIGISAQAFNKHLIEMEFQTTHRTFSNHKVYELSNQGKEYGKYAGGQVYTEKGNPIPVAVRWCERVLIPLKEFLKLETVEHYLAIERRTSLVPA